VNTFFSGEEGFRPSKKMILLTQNLLISPMAAASQEKPLAIEASEVQEKEREYNEDFLKRMLDRIDWASFLTAAKSVGSQFTWPLLAKLFFKFV
jgi:hypothetical protein